MGKLNNDVTFESNNLILDAVIQWVGKTGKSLRFNIYGCCNKYNNLLCVILFKFHFINIKYFFFIHNDWTASKLSNSDGRTIPAGTTVIVYYEALFQNDKVFSEPEKFKPERFFQDLHPSAFLAFGGGPRSCLGNILIILISSHFCSISSSSAPQLE